MGTRTETLEKIFKTYEEIQGNKPEATKKAQNLLHQFKANLDLDLTEQDYHKALNMFADMSQKYYKEHQPKPAETKPATNTDSGSATPATTAATPPPTQ